MNKRERLERTLLGETTDRVPVALWRQFPGDDQRAVDLAAAVVDWQSRFDWDFVTIPPAPTFSVSDYGLTDRWTGSLDGSREITRRVIQKSLDWTDLRVLEPTRGMLRQVGETVPMVRDGLEDGTPFLLTIPSPLSQAVMLAGVEMVIRHLRTAPDRLRTGLNTLTESTIRLLDSLRRCGLAGVYYSVQLANFNRLSDLEYREFGRPYDLRVMDMLNREWWLNILHIPGDLPMFDSFADYPVQAINWNDRDRDSEPDIAAAKLRYGGGLCGGLSRHEVLHNATPVEVRSQARNAMDQAGSRRLILSSGEGVLLSTPLSNLKAARAVVEAGR